MEEDLLFRDGEEASAAKFSAVLERIAARQQAVLDAIDRLRSDYLLRFQSGLSALTLRSCRAAAARGAGIAARFTLESLDGIEMERTTASVRCDSRSAHLRERRLESPEPVVRVRFQASRGSVEEAGNAWRVISPEGEPEGVFLVELARPAVLHQAVFDVILATPSADISVETSLDGQVWSGGAEASRSGYRILVWLPGTQARYLRLRLRPLQPDMPGDYSYSFGLTDVRVFSTKYNLRGVVRFRPRIWKPLSTRVRFRAEKRDGVEYFLSLLPFSGTLPPLCRYLVTQDRPEEAGFSWSGSYASVEPGQVLEIPGSVRYSRLPARLTAQGPVLRLEYQRDGQWLFLFPPETLWNSLLVEDENGQPAPVWPDLLPLPGSAPEGFAEAGNTLYWVGSQGEGILERSWRVSFSMAPSAIIARFLIQLSSRRADRTPVAGEAWLEELGEPGQAA